MAKLMTPSAHKFVHKRVVAEETNIVIVGTYKEKQLAWIKRHGVYNYPVKEEDELKPESCAKVKELWLYASAKGKRYCFAAELIGIQGKDEFLAANPTYKNLGPCKHARYMVFKTSVLDYGPRLDGATVFARVSDFEKGRGRTKKIAAAIKRFHADGDFGLLADYLPNDLAKLPRGQLRVCEAAVQLLFFDSLVDGTKNTETIIPFPAPRVAGFTFIDLFAGVGGIRLGFQSVGGRCVFSSEWNKAAAETYERNFAEFPFGDIQKIDEHKIPCHDVLCAGFPCQPFSISGKQKGFEDIRGTMFFEVCRIIKAKRPYVVFLENVKHLVHHDHGNTLRIILDALRDLGYAVQWRILNGSDFGVAQNRERIIIVGARNGVAFNFDALKQHPKILLKDVLDKEGDFEFLNPDEYTLLEEPKLQPNSGLMFAGYRNKAIRVAGVRPGTLHLSRVHKQPNRIYSVFGVHPTLPSQESSGRYFIRLPDNRVRKLTLHECWRIMGFPDEYVKVSTPGEQYRQLGNSVCVPMITAVAKEIVKEYFGGLNERESQ